MSASSALRRGRQAHEKLMVDRCVVHRVTKGTVIDEETGQYPDERVRIYPPASSTDEDGPCQLTFADTQIREVDAAGQPLTPADAELSLPVSTSGDVDEDDIATMTASANDTTVVGIELRVQAPHRQTYATARRLRVEEI